MKTWKQYLFLGLLAIIAIAFIGCPPEGNETTHTHEFGTAWVSNATQHWHECSCGEKSAVANHDWGGWIQTTLPSIDEAGEEAKTCSVCLKTEKQPVAQLIACTCPNGTTHYEDETCCEGDNCECNIIPRPVLCACNPKAHLGIGETCDCNGTDCECSLQEYGELYPDSGIMIYRVGALSVFADGATTMETAANYARTAYTAVEVAWPGRLNYSKVNEIHIYPTGTGVPTYFYEKRGVRLIVGFRSNRSSAQMQGILNDIAEGMELPVIIE